jgi:hypothetical protein
MLIDSPSLLTISALSYLATDVGSVHVDADAETDEGEEPKDEGSSADASSVENEGDNASA